MSAKLAAAAAVPDVPAAGPVPAEVPALDEHIGTGHYPAIRRGHDRRVVPRTEQDGGCIRGEPGRDPGNQPELSGGCDGQALASWS